MWQRLSPHAGEHGDIAVAIWHRRRMRSFVACITLVAALAPACVAYARSTPELELAAEAVLEQSAQGALETALPTGSDMQRTDQMARWTQPDEPNLIAPLEQDEVSLVPPLARGRITSRFGMRGDPIAGGSRFHSGLDIAASTGSQVFSSGHGRVVFAGWAGNYGNLIIVRHANGVETRYGHLSALLVPPGTFVRAGQVIGLVGSTGRSTGPHLHWEVRIAGRATDPRVALQAQQTVRVALQDSPLDGLVFVGGDDGAEVVPNWSGFSDETDTLPAAF